MHWSYVFLALTYRFKDLILCDQLECKCCLLCYVLILIWSFLAFVFNFMYLIFSIFHTVCVFVHVLMKNILWTFFIFKSCLFSSSTTLPQTRYHSIPRPTEYPIRYTQLCFALFCVGYTKLKLKIKIFFKNNFNPSYVENKKLFWNYSQTTGINSVLWMLMACCFITRGISISIADQYLMIPPAAPFTNMV